MNPTPLHRALAKHLGQPLTPEICAAIVQASTETDDRSHDPRKFGIGASGSLRMQVERFCDVLPELHPLHMQHWQETEAHRHALELRPDYDWMRASERAGSLVQFTVRKDGKLIGHMRVYLHTSAHTSTQYAAEDAFYLLPEHRGGRAAMRLLEFVEDSLGAIGVHDIRASTKLVNTAGRLLEHMGYTPFATQYIKIIKE